MDMQSIISTLVPLINSAAVIVVIAYFLTRSPLFNRVLERNMTWRDRIPLILIFGLFSIYGTLAGFPILGGIASIRDLGPTVAGLLAGPAVGLGAGLIGGAHRYLQGGFTAAACGIAPVAAGLAGGLLYLLKRKQFLGIGKAVLLMIGVELFHMVLALALSRPWEQAVALVESTILPMVAANALGIGVYGIIMTNLLKERALEKAKLMMEGELGAAREIQMSLVPKTFPPAPARDEFSLYATLEPARVVGGDLYDFYFAGGNRFFFMIGDVSGKGIPAALFMAVTRTVMKTRMQPVDRGLGRIISDVNRTLCEGNDASMFVTAFCGLLDITTGEVTYVNAGHNPPALVKADGAVALLSVTAHVPLGIVEGMAYGEGTLHLDSGDTLVLYTDGVTEATNREKAFFTEKRFLEVLEGAQRLSAQGIVEKTIAAVHAFAAGASPADDITLLTLRMEKHAGRP
ncbi:MAG: SpoIIE family protein phosphatase [Smithellaceae bacterium]|nr:SpoIIE family protein phosphatase [Syntrophaceae bacterium]MDD4239925.1 SpoIIE family protein phosphatase [Smithellaceae bacterium]